MSNRIKIPLYIALALLAGISGYFAFSNFGKMMDRASERHSGIDQIEPNHTPAASDPAPEPSPGTNDAAQALGTNDVTDTNVIAATTNAPAIDTNTSAAADSSAEPPASASQEIPTALNIGGGNAGRQSGGGGRIGLWVGVFVVSLIGLGLLIANDVSHFMGNRALKTLYNDEGEGQKDAEYEQAEQVWASGKHLEAIGLMRDYLNKNPREQHVALRIAEIYEKDLRNFLAAALEYEEVLKHKLPPDRWSWAAIHLCNLYFKLNQEQKGYALLRRLVKEHPNTPAAGKARKRLEQVDSSAVEEIATEQNVRSSTPAAPAESGPPSNLPPGFRPKK